MSAITSPRLDERASVMACPAPGLEVSLELARSSANNGSRLEPTFSGRNQNATLKAILSDFPPAHGQRLGRNSTQAKQQQKERL